MKMKMDIDGFEGLEKELESLSRSQAAGVVRRSLAGAAKPVLEAAIAAVPVDDGTLKKSMKIGTKLNPRQKSRHRRNRGDVEMFVGAGAPHAHLVEFGTSHSAPKPFMRPAWEAGKAEVLERLKKALWTNIEKRKSANARKAAKDAGE